MNPNELYNQALEKYNKKDFDTAITNCNAALQVDPNHYLSWNLLGNIFFQLNQLNHAQEFFLAAVKIKEDFFDGYYMLGHVLFNKKDFKNAIAIWEEASKLEPKFALLYANIAIAYTSLAEWEQTIFYANKTLNLEPENLDALYCLARVYQEKKELNEAKKYLEKVIKINPNHTESKFELSYLYLAQENYIQGFKAFESRIEMPTHKDKYNYLPFAKWEEQSLKNKNLILYHEQGFGDNIQFIRFLNKLPQTNISVGIQNPLKKLFTYNYPNINFVSQINETDNYDFMLPLMSIPYKMQLSEIDTQSYLDVDNNDVVRFKKNHLDISKLNIGLVWKGSQTSQVNHKRLLELKNLESLLMLENSQVHSLQIEQNEGIENYNINNLGKEFSDFYDTAVAIKSMDIVISVDTAVAHLAGAIGIPTYVIYEHNIIDFRWTTKEHQSIWYDSIEIYTKQELDIIQKKLKAKIRNKVNDL